MIESVKLTQNAMVNFHAQFKKHLNEFVEFKEFQMSTNRKVDKEFGRKEDVLMSQIDRVEKNLTTAFNK